uniref:Polyprotein n=1 Tax=Cliffovirus sp. TaxID=3163422 RepID=A0AAU7SRK5_9VIRU
MGIFSRFSLFYEAAPQLPRPSYHEGQVQPRQRSHKPRRLRRKACRKTSGGCLGAPSMKQVQCPILGRLGDLDILDANHVTIGGRLPSYDEIDYVHDLGWSYGAIYIEAMREHGVFFYQHFTADVTNYKPHIPACVLPLLEDVCQSLEPATWRAEERYAVWDPDEVLWCGMSVSGFPVTHRNGPWASVGAGACSFHPHWWRPAATKKSAEPGSHTTQKISLGPGETIYIHRKPQGLSAPPRRGRGRARARGRGRGQTHLEQPPLVQAMDALGLDALTSIPKQVAVNVKSINDTVDSGLKQLATALTPGSSEPKSKRDPRNKSKNLGHIVDGTMGLVTDVLDRVPVVGPITGGAAKVASGIVRAAEDVVNVPTSVVGLNLFIVLLLCILLPTSVSASFSAKHRCGNNATLITNVCDPRTELFWCYDDLCWHALGCVPCRNNTCYVVRYLGVSTARSTTPVFATAHASLNTLAAVITSCDILGVGEWCSIGLALADLARKATINLSGFSCNCSCYMHDHDYAYIRAELEVASQAFSVLTGHVWDIVLFLTKVPFAFVALLTFSFPIVTAAAIFYLLNGNYIKSSLFLMLLLFAKEGDAWWWNQPTIAQPYAIGDVHMSGHDTLVPGECGITHLNRACGDSAPMGTFDGIYNGTICNHNYSIFSEYVVDAFCINSVTVYAEYGVQNKTMSLSRVRDSCILWLLRRTSLTGSGGAQIHVSNCLHDMRPKICVDAKCYCDCGGMLTHDLCGVSHRLNPHCNVTSREGYPRTIVKRENVTVPLWSTTVATYQGVLVPVRCKDHDHIASRGFLPMPGAPYLTRSLTLEVAPGFAYDTGRVGGGMVTVNSDATMQLIKPNAITAGLPWLTHALFVTVLMVLAGGKITPFIYLSIYSAIVDSGLAAIVPQHVVVFGATTLVTADDPSLLAIFFACLYILLSLHDEVTWILAFTVKFACGWRTIAILGVVISYLLPANSVSGFKVCIDVHPEVLQPLADDVGLLIVLILSSFFLACLGVTPLVMKFKRDLLFIVNYLHVRLRLFIFNSVIGRGAPRPVKVLRPICLFLLSLSHPRLYILASITLSALLLICDLLLVFCKQILAYKANQSPLCALANTLENCARIADDAAQKLAQREIKATGRLGVFAYHHLNHISLSTASWLKSFCFSVDPVVTSPTRLKIIMDASQKLACGDVVDGLPVAKRLGAFVAVGVPNNNLTSDWGLAGPVAVVESGSNSWLKCLAITLTGKQSNIPVGNAWIMGTPLSSFMSTGFAGSIVTTFHGCEGRPIASPRGPLPPLACVPEHDYALYPMIDSGVSMEACNCLDSTCFIILKDGTIHTGKKTKADNVAFDVGIPVTVVKGSSGGPVVCKMGHLRGIITAVRFKAGVAHSIKIVPVSTLATVDVSAKNVTPELDVSVEAAPQVPRAGLEIRPYFAKTGSGKSTKVPLHYVGQGYNVLVVNPSVATTLSFQNYMKEAYGITPNIHAGSLDLSTGARLTYATYGKLIANAHSYVSKADVIILDECHSMDATTVLGIGAVLMLSPNTSVRLILLATATPPSVGYSPHPDIEEIELTSEGLIDYYTKKLDPERYRTGRHLVFCHSKSMCEEICDAFITAGINSVYYYRGEPLGKLTDDPDLVVVATDALMTGYTGNFASVTDCCLATVPYVNVDLHPTIALGLSQVVCTVDKRLQRRGRTGRGTKGTYYYTTKGAPRGGVVPDVAVLEAYDTGIAWANWGADKITTALTAYKACPFTPAIAADLQIFQAFYSLLAVHVNAPEVFIAKEHGGNFDLLHGVQAIICKQFGCGAPENKTIWTKMGLVYDENRLPPLIATFEGVKTRSSIICPLTQALQAALGYAQDRASTTAVLAAGISIASFLILASRMGVIVTKASLLVTVVGGQITSKGLVRLVPPDDALEECVDLVDAQKIAGDCYNKVSAFVNDVIRPTAARHLHNLSALVNSQVEAGLTEKVINWALSNANSLTAGACLGLSVGIVARNPVLSSIVSFLAGAISPASMKVKAMLVLMCAGVSSTLAAPEAVNLTLAGGMLGALVGATGLQGILLQLFSSYGSLMSAASLTLKLIEGASWDIAVLADLASLAMNPAASITGVALAMTIHVLTSQSNTAWMNRLLAMNLKSQILPEGFFLESSRMRRAAIDLVHRATLTSIFRQFACWASEFKETTASSDWLFGELINSAVSFIRWVSGYVQYCWSGVGKIKLPGFSCNKGIPFLAFEGTGDIDTICNCGTRLIYRVSDGEVKTPTGESKLCRAYWCKAVPLNAASTLTGSVFINHKAFGDEVTQIVAVGFTGWIKLKRTPKSVTVFASSTLDMTKTALINAIFHTKPSVVNGAQTDGVYYPNAQCPVTDSLLVSDFKLSLPFQFNLTDNAAEDEINLARTLTVAPLVDNSGVDVTDKSTSTDKQPALPPDVHIINPTDLYNICLSEASSNGTLGEPSIVCRLLTLAKEPLDKVEAVARAFNYWVCSDKLPAFAPCSAPNFDPRDDACWNGFIHFVSINWPVFWQKEYVATSFLTQAVVSILRSQEPWQRHRLMCWVYAIDEFPTHEDWKGPTFQQALLNMEKKAEELDPNVLASIQNILNAEETDCYHDICANTPPLLILADVLDSELARQVVIGEPFEGASEFYLMASVGNFMHMATKSISRILMLKTHLRWTEDDDHAIKTLVNYTNIEEIHLALDLFGRAKAFDLKKTLESYTQAIQCHTSARVRVHPVGSASHWGWRNFSLAIDHFYDLPSRAPFVLAEHSPEKISAAGLREEWIATLMEYHPDVFNYHPSESEDELIKSSEDDEGSDNESMPPLEEDSVSYSYLWDKMPEVIRKRTPLLPIANSSVGLMTNRNLICITDPVSVTERMNKVTMFRDPIVIDQCLNEQYNAAKDKASNVTIKMLTPAEAIMKLRASSARSAITGWTAKEYKEKGKLNPYAQAIYDWLIGARESPPDKWNYCTLMPKEEIFVKKDETRDKASRIIMYPDLECRLVEKIFLQDAVEKIPKAVIGEGYGFQYTPLERANKIVEWWNKKRTPFAFAMDTLTFDAQITPQDIEKEKTIYCSANCTPSQREAIALLHTHLYAGSPIIDQKGNRIGSRRCRASGVLTTSASNCLTCYIKTKAALKACGLKNVDLMICGDDCIAVAESQGPTADKIMLESLTTKLNSYGLVQDEMIKPSYDLELVTSCSSNVSYYTYKKPNGNHSTPQYYVTRDPSIPLARASCETVSRDAVNTWVGNIISNFPCLWVKQILLPHFLAMMLRNNQTTFTCEIRTSKVTMSIFSLPAVIRALHGKNALKPLTYTTREATRVANTLNLFGMGQLKWWRSKTKWVRSLLLRNGGKWAALARTLLAFSVGEDDSGELDYGVDAKNLLDIYRHGYETSENITDLGLTENTRALYIATGVTVCILALAFGVFPAVVTALKLSKSYAKR